MKKLNLALAAVAALSMASCSSDEPTVNVSQDGATTFTLTIPANAASRAMGDGQDIVGKVDLNYSVFQIDATTPTAVGTFVTSGKETTPFQQDASGNTYSTTLSLNLAKGQTYNVVFWAANSSQTAYTWTANTATVAVDYAKMATNNDELDAYFGTAASVTPGTAASATLKRPFAQLNLLTSDYNDPFVKAAYGDALANLTTSVKVKASDVNTNLNLFTGVATGTPANDVTFTAVASQLKLDANGSVTDGSMTINGTNYAWLTMDYLLVNANQSVADCEWAINANGIQQTTVSVPACPVQRNYQTNVYGALLTNPTDLNVTINPAFDGTGNYEYPLNTVRNAQDLAAALAQGGTVIIAAPLDSVDLSKLTKPVTLILNAKVDLVKVTTVNPNPVQRTIVVGKDVAFPRLNTPDYTAVTEKRWELEPEGKVRYLANLIIKGDLNTSVPCTGYCFGAAAPKNSKGQNIGWSYYNSMNNVTFENIVFTTSANENTPVIDLQNVGKIDEGGKVENITITNCVFNDQDKAAIRIQDDYSNAENALIKNVTITGNTIHISQKANPNTTNGMMLWNLTGQVTVENNTVTNAPYHGISLRPSANCNVSVKGNTLTAGHDGINLAPNGTLALTGDVNVENNNVSSQQNGIRMKGITLNGNLKFKGNTVSYESANANYNAILLKDVIGSPVVTATGNIKAGDVNSAPANYWFKVDGCTLSSSSNYSNPF